LSLNLDPVLMCTRPILQKLCQLCDGRASTSLSVVSSVLIEQLNCQFRVAFMLGVGEELFSGNEMEEHYLKPNFFFSS